MPEKNVYSHSEKLKEGYVDKDSAKEILSDPIESHYVEEPTNVRPKFEGHERASELPDSGDTATKRLEESIGTKIAQGDEMRSKLTVGETLGDSLIGIIDAGRITDEGLVADEKDEFEFKSKAWRVRKLEERELPPPSRKFRLERLPAPYDFDSSRKGTTIMNSNLFKATLYNDKCGEFEVLDFTDPTALPSKRDVDKFMKKVLAQKTDTAREDFRLLRDSITPYRDMLGDEPVPTDIEMGRNFQIYSTINPSERDPSSVGSRIRDNFRFHSLDQDRERYQSSLVNRAQAESLVDYDKNVVNVGCQKGVFGPLQSASYPGSKIGFAEMQTNAPLERLSKDWNSMRSNASNLGANAGRKPHYVHVVDSDGAFHTFTDADAHRLLDEFETRRITVEDANRNPRGELVEDVPPNAESTVKPGKADQGDGGGGNDTGIAGTGAAIDTERGGSSKKKVSFQNEVKLAQGRADGVWSDKNPRQQVEETINGEDTVPNIATNSNTLNEDDKLASEAGTSWLTPYAKNRIKEWGQHGLKMLAAKALGDGLRFIGNRVVGIGGDSEPTGKGASKPGKKRQGMAIEPNAKRNKTVLGQVQSVQQLANESELPNHLPNEDEDEGMKRMEKSLPFVR